MGKRREVFKTGPLPYNPSLTASCNGVRTMIDNEKEANELVEALNKHLPMRAYATPPLVQALRRAEGRHQSERCREDRFGAVSGRRGWCCVFALDCRAARPLLLRRLPTCVLTAIIHSPGEFKRTSCGDRNNLRVQ